MSDCFKPVLTALTALLAGALLLGSCATPTSPGGGPRDEEGPSVVSTDPESGTTGFRGREITFHFSEFVNRSSLRGALTLEPRLGIPWTLDWGRKSVTLQLERALPDSTTLIVSVGTGLTDMNGNQLGNPVRVAVSSGPRINEGGLLGRVLDARTGEGNSGNRVLLYRVPADLDGPAVYSAGTDTSGRFSFEYLGEGEYRALWVDDRNRNKTWDRGSERAQPFGKKTISLQKGSTDTLGTLYVAGADTTPPSLLGVGLFSSRRLRMRFSENIVLRPATEITVADTMGRRLGGGYPLYVSGSDPYVLYAQSERPLSPDTTYRVEVREIGDEAGNQQPLAARQTTGSAQSDTTRQRVIRPLTVGGLFPDEPVEVLYAAPITESPIRDSVKIVRGTELISAAGRVETDRNRLLIRPDGNWREGVSYEFRVWNPAAGDYLRFSPDIWQDNDLGALAVSVGDTSVSGPFRLRLIQEARGTVADTSFSESMELEGLSPGRYRLVVYRDRNGNGRWDAGTLDPFRAPEPYFIQNAIPVQSGFTGEVTVSFEAMEL